MTGTSSSLRSPRVAMVVPSLRGGGLERVVRALSLAVVGRGYKSGVFCLSGLGIHADELTASAVAVHDCQEGWMRMRGLPLQLLKALGRFKPDIVHAHSGTWFPAAVSSMLLRRPRLVFTEHGRDVRQAPSSPRLERWCAKRTDRVTTVSSALADYVRQWLTPRQMPVVIPNGIDLHRYRESNNGTRDRLRESWHVAECEVLSVAVGRLVPVKNHVGLLRAFAQATRRAPNLRLAIVGDGPLRSALVAQAQSLQIERQVAFLGFRDDVAACLQAADCFVMTSKTEGLPVSLLEAMAAGLPIVASDVGGVPEALGDPPAGVLIAPEDTEGLSNALAEVALDAGYRERLRRLVSNRALAFSLTTMVDRYCAIYEILDRRCA